MFKLKNFLILALILIPSYLFRFEIWVFPTNLWEVLVFMIFVFWLIKIKNTAFCEILSSFSSRVIFFWILVFLGIFFGALFKGDFWTGLGIIKGWFIFPAIFFIMTFSVFEKRELEKVLNAIYFSCFLTAFISAVYFFMDKATFDGRWQGIFNSPNYLAMYLSPGILVGFFKVLRYFENLNDTTGKKDIFKLDWEKLFWISSGAFILLAYYKTYSYASWTALLFSIFALIFFGGLEKDWWRKKIVFVLLILPFLAIGALQLRSEKGDALASFSERSSLSSRIMIWKASGKIIQDNWFLGIGPGNFQNKYLEYQKYYPPYLEWAVPHPHNIFLSFWVFGGLFGFLGLLGTSWEFFRTFFRSISSKKKEVIFFAIFLYFLVHGIFDTTYFKNDLAVLFWMTFLFFKK